MFSRIIYPTSLFLSKKVTTEDEYLSFNKKWVRLYYVVTMMLMIVSIAASFMWFTPVVLVVLIPVVLLLTTSYFSSVDKTLYSLIPVPYETD